MLNTLRILMAQAKLNSVCIQPIMSEPSINNELMHIFLYMETTATMPNLNRGFSYSPCAVQNRGHQKKPGDPELQWRPIVYNPYWAIECARKQVYSLSLPCVRLRISFEMGPHTHVCFSWWHLHTVWQTSW